MNKLIVTSGERFTDIDAYACAIAYAELLRLEGKNAEVVLPGILNNSITETILSWKIPYLKKPSAEQYSSIVVDVSEPSHIALCISPDSVVEIYDHRFGFEKIWRDKLGKDCHIEPVGACTTLIWEEFKKRGFANKISAMSANLLMIGTVSNTLDFGAQVTTDRDIVAFRELAPFVNLPENWKETYFSEQESSARQNTIEAIKNDTKLLDIPSLGFPLVMGQMELWNGQSFILDFQKDIVDALQSYNTNDWFMSVPSISEKINYLYTESDKVKNLLKNLIEADFSGNIGTTKKLWLRKEIRKKLLQQL